MEEYNKGLISIKINKTFPSRAFDISCNTCQFPWNNFNFVYLGNARFNQFTMINNSLYFSYKTYGFTC